MQKNFIVYLAITILMASMKIYAVDTMESGFYLGGGVGYGGPALKRPTGATQFSKNGFAWSLLAGYQWNKYFSVESSYVRERDVEAAIEGNIRANISPYFLTLAIRVASPAYKSTALFVKLGGAYVDGRQKLIEYQNVSISDSSATVFYMAGGIGYAINRHVSAALEVSTTNKKSVVPSMPIALLSIRYLFY